LRIAALILFYEKEVGTGEKKLTGEFSTTWRQRPSLVRLPAGDEEKDRVKLRATQLEC